MEKEQTNLIEKDFNNILEEKYLSYALSTIKSRSLPDVRDGLKPVHRRLLYAMLQLKLNPENGFKKCARVVGDVIGKFHPHGDVAVYDAMVRMAQSFAVRYPLVDGQGNFGSIDGDNAAAMRYTEARLQDVAMLLMKDIDQDTVDFVENYDGSEIEPLVMPASFPNLLANGSEGIAVGMATSIPPHNVSEICDALLYLIKNPEANSRNLLKFIKGPDLPTGGSLVEKEENIIKAYETGKGALKIRAKWEKKELNHGLFQIIITEIPYQVQKSRLIEKIALLIKTKKLSLINNIQDESDEEIRIVIDPKNRTVNPEILMETLFKLTDLEIRINLNMNVLNKNNVPKVLPLNEVLQLFLDHRYEVIIRKSKYCLKKIENRLEVLQGLLICYLNLDEVIHIIRESDNPKEDLIKKFQLTELQVESILNMRLRSLRKLEEIQIKADLENLSKEKGNIVELLNSPSLCWQKISDEILILKEKFSKKTLLGKRRTMICEAVEPQIVPIEALVEKEPITIICSQKSWIRSIKGHVNDSLDIKYKEGDKVEFILKAFTTDKVIIFTSDGRFFTISGNNIPKAKNYGEPLNLIIDMEENTTVVNILIYKEDINLFIASQNGKGFLINSKDIIAQTKSGKQILNLEDNDHAALCIPAIGDHIAVIGENRHLSIFNINEIPILKKGRGVIIQRYKNGKFSDAKIFCIEEGLSWKLGEKIRKESNLLPWLNKRGSKGRLPPAGFPRNNKFS